MPPRLPFLARLGVAAALHFMRQALPGVRRVAEAEVRRHPAGYLTLAHVFHGALALAGRELVIEEPRRLAVELEQPLAPAAVPAAVFLRYSHSGAAGQKFNGLREGEVLNVHDEVEHTAPLAAAEAVVDVLAGRDGEAGRLFAVEGAQTEEILTGALGQRDVLADDLLNGVALGHLLNEIV